MNIGGFQLVITLNWW